MSSTLAILGGKPVRTRAFPPHPVIEDDEKRAVMEVLDRAELSTFLAVPGKYFLGGKNVREFEKRFAHYHGVEYAVAFNSGTAALHAAVAAVGVRPGEEVIVPPYTFTSTATCALMHNAVPVFVDVDDEVYGLDPRAVARNISPLTSALIVVHLFGHPADMDGLMEIAKSHDLRVIEDCAQAPGASYGDRFVGTIGDCGVFSFTESKNVTTGEGGMLITGDAHIAEVAQMVRNHGEVMLEGQTSRTYTSSILGWNYRMTEMEAALGIVQFGKMQELNRRRVMLADYLTQGLQHIEGLRTPIVRAAVKPVYYLYALKYHEQTIGISRDLFVKALNAEGIPFSAGYVRPLYLSPLYHENRPFAFEHYQGDATYDEGICPVAERLHGRELILTPVVRPPATLRDMDDIVTAITKVVNHRDELRKDYDA